MKTGIQLYSVRNELNADFYGTMAALADMGFAGVEFAFNYGGNSPDKLAAILGRLGLQTIGIYENIAELCNPDAEVYRQASALNCQHLTFGFGMAELENNLSGCLQKCRLAMDIAGERGITLCYHAHSHEFNRLDGEYYLDLILNAPGLERLAFQADTCWIHLGGEQVIGYMEKYAERIPLLHVKDVTGAGTITELGNGVIDFTQVVDFARRHRIGWLSYEQDSTELPGLKSAIVSIDYLRQLMPEG